MKAYQDINKETIDRWVKEGWEWGKPVSHDEYIKAEKGKWNIFLTPTAMSKMCNMFLMKHIEF